MVFVPSIISVGCMNPSLHPTQALSPPTTTRSGVTYVKQANPLTLKNWWTKLQDPQLNALISRALKHNNQIKAAQANVLQAQAKLKEAHFSWLPTLSASGNGIVGGGWNSDFTPEGALTKISAFTKTGNLRFRGYYSGFVPSYSLNILKNINTSRFAKASLNLQRATLQSVRLSVISQTSGSYFMLLGQKEELKLQKILINDLKAMRQLEKVRFNDGASDLSAITELEQEIDSAEANLRSIENSISQIENAIQILIDHNPGPLITRKNINTLSIASLIPLNLPSAVLETRPDIIMAKENLAMTLANIGIAYSNFFPNISLTGLLGGASVELMHLLKLNTALWIAQIGASMPLIHSGLYEQTQEAKAAYTSACYTYSQTLRTVFADVDNNLTNQQKINQIYISKTLALRATEKNHFLAMAKYKAGSRDYRTVISAKLQLDQAKINLNQTKMQQFDSVVMLYLALGGG